MQRVALSTLYAKMKTFLPVIEGSWDVPLTAQEERTRVLFLQGSETLQSFEAYLEKHKERRGGKTLRWAENLVSSDAPMVKLAPVVQLAPMLAPVVQLAPMLAPVVQLAPMLAPVVKLAPVVAPVKPSPNPQGIRTVVARNLPRDIKDAELRTLFGAHTANGLRDLYIPKNTDRASPYFGTLKGFALVKFHTAAESTRAFLANQTLCIRGKNIALEFAKEDR